MLARSIPYELVDWTNKNDRELSVTQVPIMNIAVIAVASSSGAVGGAERFYEGLVKALNTTGVHADLIEVESDEASFESIKQTYLKFYDLDVARYDAVISTKAPSYLVRHRNHICYLVHTMRVFYDMFEKEFPYSDPSLLEQRKFIHTLDSAALDPKRIKKIFSIGFEVTNRLRKYNGLESEVLHPALLSDNFKAGEYNDYLFLPGRLHRWKRVDLLIDAMRYTKSPVKFKIAGTGEDEGFFRNKARNDPRIEFLGKISDEELIDLYAGALAVPFAPLNEDYGYVTLEAFRSSKPVITCTDSGEPAHFVKNQYNGFVCEPNPQDIAEKIDYLFQNREKAAEMGLNGRKTTADISWANIANTLIGTLR
jgi:glycosyltransferase involved in cell wall biosynthesis